MFSTIKIRSSEVNWAYLSPKIRPLFSEASNYLDGSCIYLLIDLDLGALWTAPGPVSGPFLCVVILEHPSGSCFVLVKLFHLELHS